jgi:hypothetical protein
VQAGGVKDVIGGLGVVGLQDGLDATVLDQQVRAPNG